MPKRDYYEVLEVSRTAVHEEIKKSYRKLAIKHHPDKNSGDKSAEEKFKELSEAYEVLSEPQRRAAYDQYGHAAFDNRARSSRGGDFHDPVDIFREVFGGGGGGSIFEDLFGGGERRDPNGPQRGSDLRYDIELGFLEAALGCEKQLTLTKPDTCPTCAGAGAEKGSSAKTCHTCGGRGQVVSSRGIFSIAQTCPKCQGRGKTIEKPCRDCHGAGRKDLTSKVTIKIPAGVDTGARLRSTGNGEGGTRGGPPGDLYVVIHVKPHEIFQRDGDDLICDMPISFIQAALGSELTVPTLTAHTKFEIPAGTQTGAAFRLKGKGIKNVQGYGTGDLHVRVTVEVPTHLNAAQKGKLEEFAALCDANVNPISKGFFEKAKSFFK